MTIEYWKYSKIHSINIDNAGRIGKNAKIAFMFGHCHSIALALHILKGFDIYSFVSKSLEDFIYSPSHIAVRLPNKDYLDIEGTKALIRYRETYPDTKVFKIPPDRISAGLDCFLPVQTEKAMPFAKMLLKQYNIA